VHASARLRMHDRACAAREELGVCANTGAYPMAFSFTSDTKYVPAVQNGHGRWHPGTAWYPGQQSAGLRGVRFGQSGYVRTPRACMAKRMNACARTDGQHRTNTDTRSLAHARRRAYRRLRRFLTRRRCRSSASRGR
jgi:hypothetical protein